MRVAEPTRAQAAPAAANSGAAASPGRRDRRRRARGRKYTGNPVSLDFQGADLRAVLRTFSEISGLNIVIDPAVQGTVDVALRDVPWDQALDIILRANKLGYLRRRHHRPHRAARPCSRPRKRRSSASWPTSRRSPASSQVLTKTLSYAKAEELPPLLTKSALSPRGTVQVDARTNTLIITDLPDRLEHGDRR